MTRSVSTLLAVTGLALFAAGLSGCGEKVVSYSAQVEPILERRCLQCHVPGESGYEASGLDLSTHASLMKGTRFGPIVEPGDPLGSVLNQLVEGRAHPSIAMPHGGNRLPDSELSLLREWVAQGARNN
jgi:hypothetical protein